MGIERQLKFVRRALENGTKTTSESRRFLALVPLLTARQARRIQRLRGAIEPFKSEPVRLVKFGENVIAWNRANRRLMVAQTLKAR
jgi:hypothetical protein